MGWGWEVSGYEDELRWKLYTATQPSHDNTFGPSRSILSHLLYRGMSAQAAIASLPERVKTLVLDASDDAAFGRTEKDKADVASWIENIAKGEITKPDAAKVRTQTTSHPPINIASQSLDDTLTPLTYLVSSYPTAADISLYASLHSALSQAPPATYHAHPALTRYFDHIQHLPAVRGAPSAPALVAFDLDGAPSSSARLTRPRRRRRRTSRRMLPSRLLRKTRGRRRA